MDRNTSRLINETHILAQAFPLSASGDNVVISIYDLNDNAVDVNAVAMTFENGVTWSYSWTPTEAHTYYVDYYHVGQDVHHYEYVRVSGAISQSPSATSGGTTLANLRTRFLKFIDNYNANDLTGTNSSGDVADLYINEALQTIYQDIKNTRYLDAYESTALLSVANQRYINLSAITDLDEIFAIKDEDNQIVLQEVSPWRIFFEVADPDSRTGTPYRYARVFDRIYLDPVPTSVITYTTPYKKTYARLASDSDQALIPFKYDPWIYAEARVLWLMGEDPSNIAAIGLAQKERERVRDIALADLGSQFNSPRQAGSHFSRVGTRGISFDRLEL